MKKYLILFTATIAVIITIITGFMLFNTKNAKTNEDKMVDKVVWNLPFTFNYAKSTTAGDFDNLNLLAATPFSINKNNEVEKYALSDFKEEDNGKKLILSFKDGLKYQNGEEIKAQDYLTQMKLILTPQTKASSTNYLTDYVVGANDFYKGKTKSIKGIKVLSKNKLEIDLIHKTPLFKSLLTNPCFAPVLEKDVKKYGYEHFGTEYKQVLSSGEYYVSDYKKGEVIEYTLNDTSLVNKSLNLPKKLKFKAYTNNTTAINEFKSGKLNHINKSLEADKILNYNVDTKPQISGNDTGMTYLINNTLDKNTINAMNLAIDKNYIVNQIFYKMKKVNNTFMPQLNQDINKIVDNAFENTFNLQKAKNMNVKKQTIILQTRTDASSQYNVLIKYLISQWKQIGIDVETKPVPFGPNNGVYLEHDKNRKFDVTLVNFGLDYPNAMASYDSFSSVAYWNDQSYDKYAQIIKDLKNPKNNSSELDKYKKLNEILKNSGKFIPLYQDQTQVYVKKDGWDTISYNQLLKPKYWSKIGN